jgi:ATP-dependent RNA helicase DDX60
MLHPVDDAEEMYIDVDEDNEGVEHTSDATRQEGLSDSDWNVYNVVTQVCKEFQEKFRAIWA